MERLKLEGVETWQDVVRAFESFREPFPSEFSDEYTETAQEPAFWWKRLWEFINAEGYIVMEKNPKPPPALR